MSETITVKSDDDGQRLDRWIKKHYPGMSFGDMQKILRTGQLRVDGKRVKGEARLAEGQVLRIPPQMRAGGAALKDRGLLQKEIDFIQSLVIYKDKDIIAINKPSGLATQGGSKVGRHVDGMLEGLTYGESKPHLVHRLDKDTSGVLLLARHPKAARALGDLFQGRDIKKYSWAVTSPAPALHQGKVKSYINKVAGAGGERMMAVDEEEGKMALTFYSVIENLGNEVAFVAFWPRTGRTHQIRVHAAEIGCPLLGDYKYGPDQDFLERNDELSPILHLHARRLVFRHPFTDKKVDITAPLGPEMRKTFKHFGFDANDKTDYFEDVE